MVLVASRHKHAVGSNVHAAAAAAEVELLGRTAIGGEPADLDALTRLEALGFGRALAVQALLQV